MDNTRGIRYSESMKPGPSELTGTKAASVGPTRVFTMSFAYKL